MKTAFTIWPAIDLRGGRCVRLRQGRLEQETVYGDDPAETARRWVREGAQALHVVDLDGAFAGRPLQLPTVSAIVQAVGGVPVQLGGGLRTQADVEAALAVGVRRVVVGTRAAGAPETVREWVRRFDGALAVGIDARDRKVAVQGWVAEGAVEAVELARRMAEIGVTTLIVTDIGRDGMLAGPALELIAEICATAPSCEVIASGGVRGPEDIRRLRALGCPNLCGAIVGKALYEGATSLPDLLAAAER